MSAKRQIAAELDALPESLTIEEALERLIYAFRLKQAMVGRQAVEPLRPETQAERFIRLIEEERVDEARRLSVRLKDPHGMRVLAAPVIALAEDATGQGITNQADEARGELASYAGQWVVMRGGKVIDAAPRRRELHQRTQAKGLLEGSVFLKVED